MDGYKNMSVSDLLLFLQKKVKDNVEKIKANQVKLENINDEGTDSISRYKGLTNVNAFLTAENTTLFNLFNDLVKLYKQQEQAFISEDLIKYDEEPVLDNAEDFYNKVMAKTIEGEIPLDENHPYSDDASFLIQMQEKWLEQEEFEKCMNVQKLLRKIR